MDYVGLGSAPIFRRLRDSFLITAVWRIVDESIATMTPTDFALTVLTPLERLWERSTLKSNTSW